MRRPREDRHRGWRDASASQEVSRVACNHQKTGQKQGVDSPSEPLERTKSVDTLILDGQPSELRETKCFLPLLSHTICSNLLL